MNNTDRLLNTIKERNIQPTPRWYFLIKNLLIWLGFALAILLGGLAFSVILFAIQQTDFNVTSHLGHSRLELFLGLLPFAWVFFLIIFLALSIITFRYSPKGYKFSLICIRFKNPSN